MEKPRFEPYRHYPHVVNLQKEIYRKEERFLGISPVSHQVLFKEFIKKLKPSFNRIQRKSQLESVDKLPARPIPEYKTDVLHSNISRRYNSFSEIRESHVEETYRSRIAEKVKESHQELRSPEFWTSSPQRPINRNVCKLKKPESPLSRLNSKRIYKGMGYIKSKVFP